MKDTNIVPPLVRVGRAGDVVHRAGCFHVPPHKALEWAWSNGRTVGEVRRMIKQMEMRACADCCPLSYKPRKW